MTRRARTRGAIAGALVCLGLLAVATQAETLRVAPRARPAAVRTRPGVPLGLAPDFDGGARRSKGRTPAIAQTARIPYLGGPVLHSNRTHVIFWQPAGSGLVFDPGYVTLVTQFLAGVAHDSHMTTNEYGISGEYTDAYGPAAYASSYGGSVLDTDPLPENGCSEPSQTGPGWSVCLTDAQLEDELEHVLSVDHLPAGGDNIYLLLTPEGFGDCQDSSSSSCALGGAATGYCGYHSSTDAGTLYAVIPFNAVAGHCQSDNPRPNSSTADPALSTISHEQIETITDPYGNAWIDASGNEIADVCLTDYGPALGGSGPAAWNQVIDHHHYWLQEIWSRLQGRCAPRPRPDVASISAPARVMAGQRVAFVGHGRQPGGSIDSFDWSFGDGLGASGETVSHAYTQRGTYDVVLRLTDRAGNWVFSKRALRVRPAPAHASSRRRH